MTTTEPNMTTSLHSPGQKGNNLSTKPVNNDFFIIGIGASAGGLEALDLLFSHIPQDSVSYVVVQHLAPDHKSPMRELLQRHAQLQIFEIEHDMEVKVNCIYLLTQRKYVTLRNGRLQLSDHEQSPGINRTLDVFFSSLATAKGSRAVAIILSGTGSDGTEGIMAIKRAGGLVLVQEPATAKFEGMPNSAIASGQADYILPPELMPEEIFNYVKVAPLSKQLSEGISQYDETTFQELLQLVHERTAIDFSNYKRPTIIRRITRRMIINNIRTLLEYLDYLHLHPEEIETLSKEFLINVTKFFRDAEAFVPIEEVVIPDLISSKKPNEQLRIWVAGCSSGEEAYSLAILVREHLDRARKELEVKIFASDIDTEALEYAGKGLYPESSFTHMSAERLDRYFVREEGKFRVSQRIRRMVIFAPHNVITAPPFSKIDLVSCRNMLIYLNPLLQRKALSKFHYALNMGGYLFLGSSESVGDMMNFGEVDKKWKIYRNLELSRGLLGLESLTNTPSTLRPSPSLPSTSREQAIRHQAQHSFAEVLNESVMEEFGFAAFFVDENYELIHAVGSYNKFVNLPDRSLTLNLLKIVPPDLSSTLSQLLRKAVKEKQKATAQGVLVRDNTLARRVNIAVKPFLPEKKSVQRYLLVLLNEERTEEIVSLNQEAVWPAPDQGSRVADLELELQHTKEDLQAVVEELETANEELQSTNEELLSSNEELQSTNEELQSLNEELHTINAEHQYKIKALVELDDDLNNYFRSTDISQIFVDRKLVLRKYTPAATKQINLIENDVGRSIYQISNNLKYDHLIDDLRQVIANPTVVEREVQDKNGHWYQMRILPYMTQEKQTDGAILIFVDITDLKNLNSLTRGVLDSSLNGIQAFRAIRNSKNELVDFELTLMNTGAERLLGRQIHELTGTRLLTEYPESRLNGTFETYARVVNTGEKEEFENQVEINGELRWMHSVVVKYGDGCVLTFEDITEKKLADGRLRESVSRFSQLVEAIPQITWTHLADGTVTSYNQRWNAYTGLSFEQTKGLGWQQAVHPDDLACTVAAIGKATENGSVLEGKIRFRRADGQYRWHLNRAVPLHDEQGQLTQWIGTATDIHDLLMTQQQLQENQQRLEAQNQVINNMLRNLPFILWRLSPNGVIEEALGSGLRNLNLEDNEIRGQDKAKLFPDAAPYLSRVLAGETVSYLNTYHVGGTTLYKQHYFIPDPETGGALGFSLDVTEQKQAEEEASYRNRILDTLLTNMPIALGIFNPEGDYLELKGAGLRNIGLEENEIRKKKIFERSTELGKYAQQILNGEQVSFVLHFDHVQSGERRFFQFFGFYDDQKNSGVLFSIDITNSVRTQEKLKTEKEFRETLLENSIDGIVAFDRDTRITAWNRAMEAYTGLLRDEVLGKDIFTLFPEYAVNAEGQAVRQALQGEKTVLHNHPFGIKSGFFETTTLPLLTDQQEVIGGLSIMHDMSEQKRLEDERINLKLTQQKEVLTAILQTQEEERRRIAEALHNGLGQLLYAAKLQLEEVTAQETDTKENKKIKKNLETLLDDAIRETRTISFEMMPVILEDFGLSAALRELCKRFSRGGIILGCYISGFKQRLDPELETAVYRIIQELINNIIKHAQTQEGVIHLERRKHKIQISVEDNGIGFEEGKTVQLKKGIGLNSIRNRLKLLDGEMTIQSRLGQGTIVSVEIPLAPRAEVN